MREALSRAVFGRWDPHSEVRLDGGAIPLRVTRMACMAGMARIGDVIYM